MDMEAITRCEPNHPNRCLHTGKHGQCNNLSEPDAQYCPAHISQHREKANKKRARMLKLRNFEDRLDELVEAEGILNLREEISVARIVLEQIFEVSAGDGNSLIAFSSQISIYLERIKSLVLTCHKMEKQLGFVLEKDKLLKLVSIIIEIITSEVHKTGLTEEEGSRLIEVIADKIIESIENESAPDNVEA